MKGSYIFSFRCKIRNKKRDWEIRIPTFILSGMTEREFADAFRTISLDGDLCKYIKISAFYALELMNIYIENIGFSYFVTKNDF